MISIEWTLYALAGSELTLFDNGIMRQLAWDELFSPAGELSETAIAAMYACRQLGYCTVLLFAVVTVCTICLCRAAVNAKSLLQRAMAKRRRRRTVVRVADEPELEEAAAKARVIAGKRARRQQMVMLR